MPAFRNHKMNRSDQNRKGNFPHMYSSWQQTRGQVHKNNERKGRKLMSALTWSSPT